MSFIIKKNVLFDLLQKTYPIAPAKSSLQILSNLRISCTEGTIEIIATDLDHSAKAYEVIGGTDSFSVAVNARKLYDIVREIPEGDIFFDVDGNVLILQSEKGFSCKIAGADPRDFPEFPVISEGQEIQVTASELKRMVLRSDFAVSRETSRSCLCGILWEVESNKTSMVATDGHRLGCAIISKENQIKSKIASIISPKTLSHIVKISESLSENKPITVINGDKYISFGMEKFTLCSKLIEGPYPDYEKVIPKVNTKKVIIDRVLLQECVRRVSILSNQKTHLVKFSFIKDQLEIIVLNRDIGGEAREVLPVSYDGENHSIGFNGQFFTEILSIIDSSKVRLEMNTQISACMIYPVIESGKEQKSEDFFLIMPLRIIDEA